MIHLEEKIYFYLLLLLPLFTLLYVGVQLWRARAVKRFAEKPTFSRLASETSHFKPWVKFVFFILVFTFIIIGLVNPKVGTKLETVKREGVDIVFAIDVSKSMLAEDVQPNRIEKAKHIISQVIEQLHGDRVAFVPYAAQAYPQLPLTSDYSAAKIFLQGINTDMLSSQGTAIREAIQTAVDYFKDSGQASKILVILSDGEDHEQGVGDLLQEINDKGIRTFPKRDRDGQVVITKLNQPLLEEIAQGASGKYFDGTNTREVLDNIKKALDNIEKNEYESQVFSDYKDQFQWFLAIAFVLLVIDIFISYKKTSWVRALNLFGEKEKSEK